MGSKVSVPPATAEEKALQAAQTDTLKQQQAQLLQTYQHEQLLEPVLLKQSGIVPTYDSSGAISGYDVAPNPEQDLLKQLNLSYLQGAVQDQGTARQIQQATLADIMKNQPLRQQVEQQTLERTLKALNGQLPVDPALEQDIGRSQTQLDETFRQRLGPGYETSSPYQEAKRLFFQQAEGVRESARRGDITTLGQLGFNLGGENASLGLSTGSAASGAGAGGTLQDRLGSLLSRGSNLVVGQPLSFQPAFGNLVQGYQSPIGNYMNQRSMELQASKANAENATSLMKAGISGVTGMFSFSDAAVKENIETAGYDARGRRWVNFNYTWDAPGTVRRGVIAQEIMESDPEAVSVDPHTGFLLVDYSKLRS